MIKKLTPAQEAKFPEYVKEFLAKGLSTRPMTEELKADVRQNMADIYRVGGIEPPKFYVFLDSPMACLLGFAYYEALVKILNLPKVLNQVQSQVLNQVRSQVANQVWSQVQSQVQSQVLNQVQSQVLNQVRSQVWSQVGSQVANQVESQVVNQVWSQVQSQVLSQVLNQVRSQVVNQVWSQVQSQVLNQVESQVVNQVWSQVANQVESQVANQVWSQVQSQVQSQVLNQVQSQVLNQVRSQVWSQVGSQVGSQVNNFCWGSQSAGWFSWFSYFLNEKLVADCEKIRPLVDLCGKCSFYLPYKDVVFISSNPASLNMTNGRLHSTAGPSWTYADGFCGFSLDGVAVTEDCLKIINGALPPEEALKIGNVEQRLVTIKYVGPERLLQHLNSKPVDAKGKEYVLHSLTLEGTPCKMLEMQNPSEPKKHYEFVPPEIETVNQALAWRIGWTNFKEPVAKA